MVNCKSHRFGSIRWQLSAWIRLYHTLLLPSDIPDWDNMGSAHIGDKLTAEQNVAVTVTPTFLAAAQAFKSLGMQGTSSGSTAGLYGLRVEDVATDGVEGYLAFPFILPRSRLFLWPWSIYLAFHACPCCLGCCRTAHAYDISRESIALRPPRAGRT